MTATKHEAGLQQLFDGYAAAPALHVSGLQMDSRRIASGELFLAAQGHGGHGLTHLSQALARGAKAVAWEPSEGISAPKSDIPSFPVPRLGAQISVIAGRFYDQPSRKLRVTGITGTDGKTSTAHLLAQALDRLDEPCAYLGTLGYGRLDNLLSATHTTPDPIRLQQLLAEFVEQGCRAAALEVSSHALAQSRTDGIAFSAALLTNVSRDHLDYHGTVEAYAAAKRRLFDSDDLRAVILNRDDARGAQWLAEIPDATSYGFDGAAPSSAQYVIGRDLRLHSAGLSLQLDTHAGSAQLESQLLGRFNAYNLMAVLAVLLHQGHALDDAVAALSKATTVPGRIEGFRGPCAAPLVVVDYAHTPHALEQILRAVRAHVAGQIWCVFGCGGDRDRGKRPLMGAAAARFADRLIVTDDNPRSEDPAAITGEILAGIAELPRVIHDRALAIETAIAEAGSDDAVVVAGKGHEDYQIYGSETRAFSDRAFVAQRLGLAG